MVIRKLLTANQMKKQLAIEKGSNHNGVPAITVAVDGGWSKRSHKHSCNVNSGVGVIHQVATNNRATDNQICFHWHHFCDLVNS